jgi:O-antigen/teichoic acid export membrane protein
VRPERAKPSWVVWGRSAAARHALALATGTVVAGIAAYAYIAVGTREYGAASFAPIAVIWSVWPAAAAGFGFPLEQWIARELAAGPRGEARVHAMLRSALPAIVAICVAAGLVCWAVGNRVFGESGLLYPVLLVAVSLGAASMGVLRGGLAGQGRYQASAVATALENAVRLLAALVVVGAGWGVKAYAAVLVLGPLVGLLWPTAFRYRRSGARGADGAPGLGELAGAALLAQIVLAAAPVILAAMVGATAAVTAVFVSLALLRAPYLIAVGISVRALPRLTRSLASGATAMGSLLRRIAFGSAIGAIVAAAIAPLLLPGLVGLVFGDEAVPPDGTLSGLAAGVVGAHGALAAMVVLIAAGRSRIALRAWIVACLANAGLLAVLPIVPEVRVAAAFAGAEIVAVIAMAIGAPPRGRTAQALAEERAPATSRGSGVLRSAVRLG